MGFPKLQTLNGEIAFDEAIQEEFNMLPRLSYCQKRDDFSLYLDQHRTKIEALVSSHLGLKKPGDCQLTRVEDWIYGSFNVCLPVTISHGDKHLGKRVIIRFPLPYKTGELECPGNADEKLRCEAATYVWIEENCPDVPIPRLWGFGFSNGYSFTTPKIIPFYKRWMKYLQQYLSSLLNYPVPCKYIRFRRQFDFKMGYLLIDYIEKEDGTMLSESWKEFRYDKIRRNTLFRSLSSILLSLGRVPLPLIGSFTINNEGAISLTNRPLTLRLQQLENEKIPTNMSRDLTYTTIEPYLLDKLALHDSRLRHQPNAVHGADDCRTQMAVLTGMRSVVHHFYSRNLRKGPFLLTLTDVHQSNLFVDENWHIKYVIDLEWACSLPIEMQHPPYWLTDRDLDELDGEHLGAFDEIRKEFMDAFEREEKLSSYSKQNASLRTCTMNRGWDTGKFFYFHALESTVGVYGLFWQHIQPMFASSHLLDDAFDRIYAPYWEPEAEKFISNKLEESDKYNKELQYVFEAGADKSKKGV